MKRLRHLATTARVGTDYHHDEVGFNYRMTNLQAAVGCAQIERLDRLLAAKRHIRSFYDRELARPGLAPFPSPSWGESACWFSGFTIEDERLPQVSALCSALRASAIEARPFWKPVHLQPPYRDAPRLPLPNAEERWSRVLTLPCSTALTDGDLTRVVDAVRAALVQV
jgi:dTDP-4-amino-4,6-dideoxygalactose transaminase